MASKFMNSTFNPFANSNTFSTGMLTPIPGPNFSNNNLFSNHSAYDPFSSGSFEVSPINLTGSGTINNFAGISMKQMDIEDQIKSPMSSAVDSIPSSLPSYEAATSEAENATEAIEGGVEAEGIEAGPESAIVEAGRMAGQFINNAMTANEQNSAINSYQNDLATMHGIGTSQIASAKFSSAEGLLNVHNLAGNAGAFLGGPLGALLGRGISSFFDTTPNLNIANSGSGSFNPQSSDLSTAQSQSSAQLLA